MPRPAASSGTVVALILLTLLMATGCQPRPEGVTVVTVGGTTTPNTPGEATFVEFKRNVEEATGGRLRLRNLIYGQLGSEEQLLSSLRRGRIQFANLSAQAVSTLQPELSLLYAPFLFDSEAEADYVYDRYLTDVYRDLLAANDLHLITWYEIGFNDIWGREPLYVPADLRGRRFRVSSSLNARLFAESVGADVIPLGFGEIVSSIQTGLIDAGENAVTLYARTGIAGEAPHLTLTDHSFGISVIVSRKQWWDGLPPSDRQALEKSFPGIAVTRKAIRAQNRADLGAGESLGFEVHRITEAQRQLWRDATSGITPRLVAMLGGRTAEILAGIERTRAEYRAQSRPDASPAEPPPSAHVLP